MTERTRATFALLVAVAALALATPAAAQQTTPTPETPTPTNSTALEDSSATVQTIGPLTRIKSWSYQAGTFTISIEADAPVLLTVSQLPDGDSQAGQVRVEERSLAKGPNKLEVTMIAPGSSPTVFLTTAGSLDQGRAAYLRAEGGSPLIEGPFSGSDLAIAVAAALGTTGVLVLIRVLAAKAATELEGEQVA